MRKFLFSLVLIFATSSASSPQPSGMDTSKRLAVEANIVTILVRLTSWPAGHFKQKKEPLVVAVLMDSAFHGALEKAFKRKKDSRNRPVRVIALKDPEDILKNQYHVLLVGTSASKHWKAIAHKLKKRPVLTLSKISGFAKQGGHLALFVKKDGTIGFRVNLREATSCRLKFSSKLLRLGEIVETAR